MAQDNFDVGFTEEETDVEKDLEEERKAQDQQFDLLKNEYKEEDFTVEKRYDARGQLRAFVVRKRKHLDPKRPTVLTVSAIRGKHKDLFDDYKNLHS